MELSDFVTLVTTVPESHADSVREAIGHAGAGKIGNYSHCSFSTKGMGRFMPNKGSSPFIGKNEVIEMVVEERIEVPCSRSILDDVIKAIKKSHPYEQPMIAVFPCYEFEKNRND
ncbi:MAG TPA: hypothetical protein VLI69_04130 [Gammaproteobacteria bacterium]|nr:hypothetical protein [Gammaproteobacteria bacterium]